MEWVLEPQGHFRDRPFRNVWTPRRLKRMGTSLMTRDVSETEMEMNETDREVSEMGDESTEGREMAEETESTRGRYGSEEEDF